MKGALHTDLIEGCFELINIHFTVTIAINLCENLVKVVCTTIE